MNIARILYPVKTLGIGNRLAIWVCGCKRKCKGCANPELWERKDEFELSISDIIRIIQGIPEKIEGFTITGGEPFDQVEELYMLVKNLHDRFCDDVLIYTGYRTYELEAIYGNSFIKITEMVSAIVDGEYIEELNTGSSLKGSDNQKLHIYNSKYDKEYRRLESSEKRTIQSFLCMDGSLINVGFEKADFKAEYENKMKKFIDGD